MFEAIVVTNALGADGVDAGVMMTVGAYAPEPTMFPAAIRNM